MRTSLKIIGWVLVLAGAYAACAAADAAGPDVPRAAAEEDEMNRQESKAPRVVSADLPPCYKGAETATAVRLPDNTGNARLVTMGKGERGIAFAPISWGDVCEWSSEAKRLAGAGYRVITFDWGPDREETVTAAVDLLRAQGATSVALVGGCMGGTVMLGMSSAMRVPPVAIAGISPLAELLGARVNDGERYKGEVLLLGTKHDPLADESRLREVARSFPGAEVVVLSGDKHAAEIFASNHTAVARRTLDAFLERAFSKRR